MTVIHKLFIRSILAGSGGAHHIWDVEAGGFRVGGHPRLHSEFQGSLGIGDFMSKTQPKSNKTHNKKNPQGGSGEMVRSAE